MTEAQLHRQVASFLNARLLPPAVWTTFPAGENLGGARGRIVKARGMRAGWPDIQIINRGRLFFIELKAAKGWLSAVQIECHEALRCAGCVVWMCRSLEDVKEVLEAWEIPLRKVSLSTERMTQAIEKLNARVKAAGEVA